MLRERLLEENAVDGSVAAESVEGCANGLGRGVAGQIDDVDVDARRGAGSDKIAHVGDRRFVLADEDDRQARMNPGLPQRSSARE